MALFTREYLTPSGMLEVKITYDRTYTQYFLDFDVLDDIEFEYGYEDEDQLTFFPNGVHFVFDDFKKQNYDVLKLSVGAYANSLPENHMQFGGVEVLLDGATKFKGYIEELSLEYDEEDLTCKFSAYDLTLALKNMNVDRDKIIGDHGLRLNDPPYPLPMWLYGLYKQFWPEFTSNSYYWNQINTPGLFGFFIKHDWKFYGNDVIQTCKGQRNLFNGMPGDPWPIPDLGHPGFAGQVSGFREQIRFNFDSTNMFGNDRPCRTWTDYLRLVALQFGAIIGVMDYGKVYFIKRFGNYNAEVIDLSDRIIEANFSKKTHLPVLRGVIVNNHWNGDRTYEYGDVEKTPNGEPKYVDRIKTLETNVGSYLETNGKGTCIYTIINSYYVRPLGISGELHCGNPNNYYTIGCWDVRDPQLNTSGQLFELIAQWQRDNRITPKDQVEVDLWGIDYDMVSIYRITPPGTGNLAVNFRPMRMTKSILKNQTHIVGIEV